MARFKCLSRDSKNWRRNNDTRQRRSKTNDSFLNEGQRQTILSLIKAAPISGNFEQVTQIVAALAVLKQEVEKADLKGESQQPAVS